MYHRNKWMASMTSRVSGPWVQAFLALCHAHFIAHPRERSNEALARIVVHCSSYLLGSLYSTLLVGGWATPLKNMSSSIGMIIPNIWENKIDVPNHQPDYDKHILTIYVCLRTGYPIPSIDLSWLTLKSKPQWGILVQISDKPPFLSLFNQHFMGEIPHNSMVESPVVHNFMVHSTIFLMCYLYVSILKYQAIQNRENQLPHRVKSG